MEVKYIITGGSGFIGTNLIHFLSSTVSNNYISLDINPKYGENKVDVGFKLINLSCNTLVHLASITNIRDSLRNPKTTFIENCYGIANCLEHLRSGLSKTLIFTSSASSSLSKSPYLASKLAGESLCTAYKESFNLDVKILKLSSVYGPHSKHKSSVIHSFIKNCLNHKSLIINGSGDQERDFIHVSDVVSSICDQTEGYISSGTLTSINKVAELISSISSELINFKPKIIRRPAISGEVHTPDLKSDINPKISLQDGLLSTFKWYMVNYDSQRVE